MAFILNNIARKIVQQLPNPKLVISKHNSPYKLFLNNSENPFGSPLAKWYNRFADAEEQQLIQAIAVVKNIHSQNIIALNGIQQTIDILLKCFCEPNIDNVIICPPTNYFFSTNASLLNVQVKEAPLLQNFQPNLAHIETLIDANTKIIFLCNPNTQIGNAINRQDVETILNNFDGLVVIDEAYINFSNQKSFVQDLLDYPNLVILQNFNIAWGLAGLGVNVLLASTSIIQYLLKIKPTYTIAQPVQELMIKALQEIGQVNDMIQLTVAMRNALANVLSQMPIVQKVYDSQTNFICVAFVEVDKIHNFLLQKNIVVNNISHQPFCENCLSITIGTEQEITHLVDALIEYMNENFKN